MAASDEPPKGVGVREGWLGAKGGSAPDDDEPPHEITEIRIRTTTLAPLPELDTSFTAMGTVPTSTAPKPPVQENDLGDEAALSALFAALYPDRRRRD